MLISVEQAGIPLAYIFSDTEEERTSLAETLRSVAEKHKGKVNFATIDAKSFGQHGGNLNLEVGKWPAFAIQDVSKNQKFPYSDQGKVKELSEKNIGKFVDDFVAGKIEPSIKSEPIPEKQDGPVTVVVAKNYQDLVIDNKKDVLIEFYAPWCGHCKALAPKYEELAGLYKDYADKVTVAKVDATANDVPDEIQGFPTIRLYKADDKEEPVEYSGSRTVEDIANFIRDNGSHGVDVTADTGKGAESMDGVETDQMPMQAPAATEAEDEEGVKDTVTSVASKATEAVKSAMGDDEEVEDHDEL